MLENASCEICIWHTKHLFLFTLKNPSEIACGEQPSVQDYTSELLFLNSLTLYMLILVLRDCFPPFIKFVYQPYYKDILII